jgi:bifunctional non-homologous end joining protein LigD
MAATSSKLSRLRADLADRLRPVPLPKAPRPMLATLVDGPFDHPDWFFETKYDGLRILGRRDGRKVVLLSRNDQPQNFQFPDIVGPLQKALTRPAIVDGEIVCLDEKGQSSFRLLQQRFHLQDAEEVQIRVKQYPAYLYLFDLLYWDRFDLTGLPLEERKKVLRAVVRWSERIRWTEHVSGKGKAFFQRACREGGEGIIGKQRTSLYVASRSASWVKIKCVGRQEFVIGGFTDPQRSRVGLGALLVGYYSDDGKQLRYAGKVGTGYTRETLLDLRRQLDKLTQKHSPFDEDSLPRAENTHWVRPQLVAEIAFGEWTQHGHLRMPRFQGLRPDKSPRECKRERPRKRTEPVTQLHPEKQLEEDAMSLETYRKKRNFRKTPEPAAERARSHSRPIFVIQEHHASHLHYDFRLEADGVLKSWAVPKEPGSDPSVKRLAVRVEDHPLDYAKFEGDIPEGEYGAGHVAIWDRGTYDNLLSDKPQPQSVTEGIAAGRLEFFLHGKKLRGRFALVRMKKARGKKENWLLIKMKDEYVRAERKAKASVRR